MQAGKDFTIEECKKEILKAAQSIIESDITCQLKNTARCVALSSLLHAFLDLTEKSNKGVALSNQID